jgi:hypothetical protein
MGMISGVKNDQESHDDRVEIIYSGNKFEEIIELFSKTTKFEILASSIYSEIDSAVLVVLGNRILTLGHFYVPAYIQLCVEKKKTIVNITYLNTNRVFWGWNPNRSSDKGIIHDVRRYINNNITGTILNLD